MDNSNQIDEQFVEDHFRRHHEELNRFLIGLLGDSHLAADALQSTFTKLIQSASSLKPVAIRAWLFRVAYNQAMEYRRHGDVNRRALQKIASDRSGTEHVSPIDSRLHYDQVEKIKNAMKRLTEGQQQVVHLRIYHDKKFAEIARELGLPLGTVLTRMRTALRKLSTELEP